MAECLTLDDLTHMVCTDRPAFSITPETVKKLFCLSKMTVLVENDEKGPYNLQKMNQVEFLEFLGRLAHARFMGTDMHLLSLD